MSGHSPNLSPVMLSDKDKLCGYENYASWKILMEAHGCPKGLHKYWQNKITVPDEYLDVHIKSSDEDAELEGERDESDLAAVAADKAKISSKTPISPKTTPLHSTTPLELEYELCESIVLSSIIINVVDVYGSSINPDKQGKVAGEDGHIKKMQTLCQQANEAGAKINDAHFTTKLLDSFPDSWDPVTTLMYGESDLAKIIMNLTIHAERLAI